MPFSILGYMLLAVWGYLMKANNYNELNWLDKLICFFSCPRKSFLIQFSIEHRVALLLAHHSIFAQL